MKIDRKKEITERRALMLEFSQVRQAMRRKKKEKPGKNDVAPQEVLIEIQHRIADSVSRFHHRKK